MREDLWVGHDSPITAQPADPEALKQGIVGIFDRSAETYDQVGVHFFTPLARDLVARAALRPSERVLDVGAGRGAVLFAAASAVGSYDHVVGIDLSATTKCRSAHTASSAGAVRAMLPGGTLIERLGMAAG